MRRIAWTSVLGIVIALMAGVVPAARLTQATGTTPPPPPGCATNAPHGGHSTRPVVDGADSFGFRLLQSLYAARRAPNVLISPTSIDTVLTMAELGASIPAEAAIGRVLGVSRFSNAETAYREGHLLQELQATGDKKVQLQIADSLWAQTGHPLNRPFAAGARFRYGATVNNVDLQSPAGPNAINGWVACATHNTIKQIVNSTSGSLAVLVNALYFHGRWTQPFNKYQTFRAPFTTGSGAVEHLPTMHQTLYLPYGSTPQFQAVSIPYGNGRYSFVVVLPRTGTTLQQIVAALSLPAWRTWTAGLHGTQVALSLPRFTTDVSLDLTVPLAALGMRPAFAANGMNRACPGCSISAVLHKTHLMVNENGTIASAATAVILAGGGLEKPPKIVNVNHPFLLAIRDRRTGAVLFVGAINKPA